MNPQLSSSTLNSFFAWAPLVVGLAIYLAFYIAKRHEGAEPGAPIGQTYACAACGRRGARDQMVPQQHGGAVSWYCGSCATSHATAH
ncbi:MAG: hypothetical protein WA814_11720 [Candidatus Baltobacteraceae bacterium]